MERGISELFLQRPSLGRDPVSEQPQESPPPGLRRPRCDTRGSGALYSSCRKPRASGKPSGARVGGGPAGERERGPEGRALGGGRGGPRGPGARPALASGLRPRPPGLPLPLHPGEGVPETAPSLTPPPRFPGSSLRRRSSTMPDSFDTLQRQRPEGGGRGERGGRGGGERRKGRCELGRRRAFGTLSEPPHPQSPRNSSVSPAAVSERA